jgi:PPE-repeat protein
MLDFGILPPEITSARMYSGPGSGPLMAAASAWDCLAMQLDSLAAAYSATITELQGEVWTGPASEQMAAAAAPYAKWAAAVGIQAEQTASQARAAAAAYETAHATIVPPAMVTANRTLQANLVATNVFGQNTAQIAETDADYAEMWAQDTHAMFGYATSASSAMQLSPFEEAPQTTNPAGAAAQAAAATGSVGNSGASHSSTLSQLLTALPQQLQGLSSGRWASQPTPAILPGLDSSGTFPAVDGFNTLTGPAGFDAALARTASSMGIFGISAQKAAADASKAAAKPAAATAEAVPPAAAAGAAESGAAGVRNAVLASVGEAAPVGQLSVPAVWADATPANAATVEPLLLSEVESSGQAPAANMAGPEPAAGMGPMAGMAGAAGMGARSSVTNALRVTPRRFKMPRPSSGG